MDEKNKDSTTLINEVSTTVKPGVGVMEVLMFSFFIAKTLSDTVIVNLLERSTCLVVYGLNLTNCTDPVTPSLEGDLQQSAATLVMTRSMIEAFVPSLLSLFIGPWSDTNGRRPLILLSLAGYTFSAVLWCLLSLIPGLHPMFFLFTSLPIAAGGGYVTFFLAIYCYVSDSTEFQHRAFRMGLLEAACLAGVLLSSLFTPYLLDTSADYGFSIVFALSALLMLVTFLSVYCFVQESVHIVESERTKLWRIDHVKEVFKTCFKSRPNHVRTIIMCMIVNLTISIMIFDGEMKVLYMFLQKNYEWDLVYYTRLASFNLIIAGSSVVWLTWLLMSVLNLSDLPVMFMGSVCMFVKTLLQALAKSGLYFYVAGGFTSLTILVIPLSRSLFSKIVPPDELGKIFAFSSFVEATAPLAAAPIYTSVYKTTMDTLPTAVFWLSSGLAFGSIILIGLAMVLHWLSSSTETEGSAPLLSEDSDRGTSVET